MPQPKWLPLNFILEIHSAQIAEHGGADGIRDEGLLESALSRPLNAFNYGVDDLCELAALYGCGIIQNHPFFQFDGDGNLVCEVPISPDEAVLGAKIDVPTPDGSVTVNIPAGIRSGQTLRLRGKGWPKPKGSRTDQLVRVMIKAP